MKKKRNEIDRLCEKYDLKLLPIDDKRAIVYDYLLREKKYITIENYDYTFEKIRWERWELLQKEVKELVSQIELKMKTYAKYLGREKYEEEWLF